MTEVNFLEDLRTQTGPMHKTLEQTAISKQIISPKLNSEEYTTYLQKMLCIHQSVEETVFPIITDLFNDLDERKKTPKLLSDLKSLAAIDHKCQVPFINNEFKATIPFCIGIIYVTEGSTLGGMHILKNVSSALGEQAKKTSHFLNCYGQHTGSKWKAFLEILNIYINLANEKEKNELIAGAIYGFNRTFEIFNR